MMFDYDDLEVQENVAGVVRETQQAPTASCCQEVAAVSSEVSSAQVASACSPLLLTSSAHGGAQESAPTLGVDVIDKVETSPISETSPEILPSSVEENLFSQRSTLLKLPSVGTWWMQRARSLDLPLNESTRTFSAGTDEAKHDTALCVKDECFQQEQEPAMRARHVFHSCPSVATWFTRLLPDRSFPAGTSASQHLQPLPVDTGSASPCLQPLPVDRALSQTMWSGNMAEDWDACPMQRLAKVHSCASMLSKPEGAAEVRQLAAAVLRDFLGKDDDEPLTERELRTLTAMGRLNILAGMDIKQPH